MSEEHRGIWPILYAFFDGFGMLDRGAMRAQVEACVGFGAHGMAALGLATEVSKLTPEERRRVMSWLAEDLNGRLPFAITVFGATQTEQIEQVRAAADLGAAWVILQPPQGARGASEGELMRFFASVVKVSPIPVGLQNAPQYLGSGLSDDSLTRLARDNPQFRYLKGEGPALSIADTIMATDGALSVFNGRGGLELPDNHRAGCAGLIPAPECADVQVRIWEAMDEGREEEAESLYAQILPLVTFLMQSVDQFLCYGKRLTARRLGIQEVHDRAPAQAPTVAGLAAMERYGRGLEGFG